MKFKMNGGMVVSALISLASIAIGVVEKGMEKKRINAEIAKASAKAVAEALADQAKES